MADFLTLPLVNVCPGEDLCEYLPEAGPFPGRCFSELVHPEMRKREKCLIVFLHIIEWKYNQS